MPVLQREGGVFVLDLGEGENRFHPDWLAEVSAALTLAESADGPRALITVGGGRFYSNGLDLDWAGAHPDAWEGYLVSVEALYARILTLPMFTIAIVQGHAFGAGAMLALAHDHQLMRADRGFWCLPETDLGLAFTPGMAALIRDRLQPDVAREAMLTARRYGGEDAAARRIVNEALPLDQLPERAHGLAQERARTAGESLGLTKRRASVQVLSHLTAASEAV